MVRVVRVNLRLAVALGVLLMASPAHAAPISAHSQVHSCCTPSAAKERVFSEAKDLGADYVRVDIEMNSIFEAQDGAINLLLTDIVMPEMHGPALAARLAAGRPDLRVLYVSGYSDAMPETAGGTNVAFLPKPFTTAELVAAVREALAR